MGRHKLPRILVSDQIFFNYYLYHTTQSHYHNAYYGLREIKFKEDKSKRCVCGCESVEGLIHTRQSSLNISQF